MIWYVKGHCGFAYFVVVAHHNVIPAICFGEFSSVASTDQDWTVFLPDLPSLVFAMQILCTKNTEATVLVVVMMTQCPCLPMISHVITWAARAYLHCQCHIFLLNDYGRSRQCYKRIIPRVADYPKLSLTLYIIFTVCMHVFWDKKLINRMLSI